MKCKTGSVALLALLLAAGVRAGEQRRAGRSGPVRSGPAAYYPVVDRLAKGEKIEVLKSQDRWLQVRTPRRVTGWVSSRIFQKPRPARGYQKLLRDRGLEGTSVSVLTLAGRGLASNPQRAAAARAPLQSWLAAGGFRPEGLGDFLERLEPRTCPPIMQALAAPAQQEYSTARHQAEHRLGEAAALQLLGTRRLVTDAARDDYLNKVGTAVALVSERYDVPWRFVLFADKQPRLLALPGGLVLLSTGLVERLEDEAELAATLAVAVAHIVLEHGVDELGRLLRSGKVAGLEQAARLVLQVAARPCRGSGFDRALRLAAALSSCAGYDPRGLVRVLERLPGLWGLEPAAGRQLARKLEALLRQRGLAAGAVLRERFLVGLGSTPDR